ncbi:unnamed protein product [Angiostrongylus costaricensis]|uniref:Polo kinase n=1 Tax=Angiostrongylus costaricensis TaxID=334426 RepID=A0A0R3PI60_ANGCS|nr:unnamed protein product [Angiostrongylus costaricensis]
MSVKPDAACVITGVAQINRNDVYDWEQHARPSDLCEVERCNHEPLFRVGIVVKWPSVGLRTSLDRQHLMAAPSSPENPVPENKVIDGDRIDRGVGIAKVPEDGFLSELYEQISSLCNARVPDREVKVEDEAPEAMPIFWISKWVDCSDKYGIGYQLSDNSVIPYLPDRTRYLLSFPGTNVVTTTPC